MTTLIFEPRFHEPVLSGLKVHTIRRPRKHPIKPGDELSLRAWEGKPYRSKQRVLRNETCMFVRECRIDAHGIAIGGYRIGEPNDLDQFAVSDGFDNWEQMRTYRDFNYNLPFCGVLIQWGVHPMLVHLAITKGDEDV